MVNLPSVLEDYGEKSYPQLLTDTEECTQAVINLLVTGQAVQYLHNGNFEYDDDGSLLVSNNCSISPRADRSLSIVRDDD